MSKKGKTQAVVTLHVDGRPPIREFVGNLVAVSNGGRQAPVGSVLVTMRTSAGSVQLYNKGYGWFRRFTAVKEIGA